MGLQIGDIVPRHEIKLEDLKSKIIAVDAFNALYQFLSSIRQPDGTPLMDSKQRVTSHLSGLFYRNLALIEQGVKLVYVFDGDYHPLKGATQEKRLAARADMQAKYSEAKDEEDIDAMSRYSRGFMKLTSEMIAESKELLSAMGIAVVQAPGEGEMQAADLVKRGEAHAVASQDYDALVCGARMIQNLTLAKKRRLPNGDFIYISPELIDYDKTIMALNLTGDQLICLAILVGTDFNPGGIKGIGPKKALGWVKDYPYPVLLFEALTAQFGSLDFDWKVIFEMFKKPNVNASARVSFPSVNEKAIVELLVHEHDFSLERVEKQLDKLRVVKKQAGQKRLF